MDPIVKVIEHSISPDGVEACTIQTRYWRPIHAEVMTHRKFGRNARSSRAVPVAKLLKEPIIEPMFYGANQSGMTSGEKLGGWRYLLARGTWLSLAAVTKLAVRILNFAGLHKQWANRPLEWFGSIDVLITSTSWKNFDTLRISGFAQPELHHLANLMKEARLASTPKMLLPGEWHLPYVTDEERRNMSLEECKVLSVARCARLTYKPFDGGDSYVDERKRYERLVVSQPVHASPAEHQLTPDMKFDGNWMNPRLHGNTEGYIQLRKLLPNEFVPG